jgi:hypothetical protein
MANLRLAPRVTATKARLPRRRASRKGSKIHTWMVAIKVAWLLERFRRPRNQRSAPSIRQIALAVVSAGLAILAIRAVTRRVRTTPDADAPTGTQNSETTEDASTEPSTGNDTVAGEDALTDRVQNEMFGHSEAPTTGSG